MSVRIFAFLCVLMLAAGASAQEEEPLTNLQVIPAHTPREQVIDIMRGFSRSLGVRCEHCHVEKEVNGREQHDFAADDKPEKLTAREMMRMVAAINGDYMSKLDSADADGVKVKCITCHRGFTHPVAIEDVLTESYTDGGAALVLSKFDELRSQYYGSSAYDFRESVLNGFASDLSDEGHGDDALKVLDANLAYFPESTDILLYKGRVYLDMGNTTAAKELVEKVLAAQPDNRYAKRMLQMITNPRPRPDGH